MSTCPQCGWWTKICKCTPGHVNTITYDWARGWYEHIGPKPVYIESKEHLFRECEKHGNLPRAFLKPRSQGKGYEIKRRIV